jgi:hypothetical protein
MPLQPIASPQSHMLCWLRHDRSLTHPPLTHPPLTHPLPNPRRLAHSPPSPPPPRARYALNALVAPQFYCEGSGCVSVTTYTFGAGGAVTTRQQDRYAYVSESFGVDYATRWHDIGYLCVFIAGFQVAHFLCLSFVSHLRR